MRQQGNEIWLTAHAAAPRTNVGEEHSVNARKDEAHAGTAPGNPTSHCTFYLRSGP